MVFKVGSSTVIDNNRLFQNIGVKSPLEKITLVAAAATGTINIDLLTTSLVRYTLSSTANWTLNFRGGASTTLNSSMAVGDSISFTFISTQGATGYYNSAVTIDGTAVGVTLRYAYNQTITTGNTNCFDLYSYNIIKTAATPTYEVYITQNEVSEFGEVSYTTPGTYTWVCPMGVSLVDAVCVGGGGGGILTTSGGSGGGGGGLGYKNNIAVNPGESYTVVVGAGGNTSTTTPTSGGQSYFISAEVVAGNGGGGAASALVGGTGGTYVGDGGGNGGNGGSGASTAVAGGGGGAGGYAGNGGNGATGSTNNSTAGAGGGGGGGGGSGSGRFAGCGGGVGILGQGSNGSAGGSTTGDGNGGFGGSGGNNAVSASTSTTQAFPYTTANPSTPGAYGGGSGGADTTAAGYVSNGASGAVRIIWGSNRAFPSTNTAKL